jgi:hypothetical protein
VSADRPIDGFMPHDVAKRKVFKQIQDTWTRQAEGSKGRTGSRNG